MPVRAECLTGLSYLAGHDCQIILFRRDGSGDIIDLRIASMIGREEDREDVKFTVSDRRKYNPDGSLKEGVEIKPQADSAGSGISNPKSEISNKDSGISNLKSEISDAEETEHDDFPGADNPASFVHFLSTIATNAAAALGAVPHPASGQHELDLETGKYWLDVLGMLKEKTRGNLHPRESKLLDGLLADLRMQYVTMVRATEERLKAQAAKKFSGAEVLGTKR